MVLLMLLLLLLLVVVVLMVLLLLPLLPLLLVLLLRLLAWLVLPQLRKRAPIFSTVLALPKHDPAPNSVCSSLAPTGIRVVLPEAAGADMQTLPLDSRI